MENTKNVEMEDVTIVDAITEEKEEQKEELDLSLSTIGAVAIGGALKQLADSNLYYVGLGVGLLFGKKAGLKTIGTVVAIGSVWNTARYMTGEYIKKE
jgi:hypothetical protein